jgi:predicted nuclease of restriction endonuclease-like (RecB) superfamily
MRQFYQTFQNRYALRSELTWTHYRLLMRMEEQNRREFYLNESANEGWTSRQLDESIVKYSVLAENENLFASKYRLYLPSEDELRAELQRERELIEQQIEEEHRA